MTLINRIQSVISITLFLFLLSITSAFFVPTVFADPKLPLSRLPICGDQDGSEPLTFQCQGFTQLNDVQTFMVPGSGGVEVNFDFIFREAIYNNELGYFLVDDRYATIQGLKPGDGGYMQAALNRAKIIFPSGSNAGSPDTKIQFNGGDILTFFMVQNSTLSQLKNNNPANVLNKSPLAFFTINILNPDGVDHFVSSQNTVKNYTQFGFEDITGGGDKDYDDVAYNTTPPLQIASTTISTRQSFACPKGLGNLCALNSNDLGTVISNIITALVVIAIILAVIFLIWGGIKWILAGGDKAKIEAARNTIVGVVIGLILVFLAYFIVTLVAGLFGVNIANLILPRLLD